MRNSQSDVESEHGAAVSMRSFTRQGFWAVVDQFFFASSNFVLGILLARWLDPGGLGVYSIVFAIFLLVSTIQTAFVSEPMLVFGPSRFATALPAYIRKLISIHWKITTTFGIALGISSAILMYARLTMLGYGVMAVAVACPFILLQWTLRRACYVCSRPRLASGAALTYAFLTIAGGFLIFRLGMLSPAAAFLLMGAASAATSLGIALRLNLVSRISPRPDALNGLRMAHWDYGRWASAASVPIWITANGFFFVLPLWSGVEVTGAYRALLNLVLPMQHFNTALGLALLPLIARGAKGRSFGSLARRTLAIFVFGGIAYWFFLYLLATPIMHWLYLGKYDEFSFLAPLVGLLAISSAFITVFGAVLRARGFVDAVFWSYAGAAIVTILGGILLIPNKGLGGATTGTVLASCTAGLIMGLKCIKTNGPILDKRTARSEAPA